ncbi:MAG: PepSY domain-containing protein [Bacteroidetes bacterium]|nr:PepSY domain-containing protein [Bacteroidota bacterium]
MNRKEHATLLRAVRKIHRTAGIALFLLFLIIAGTGILLGWKKNSNEYLMPRTYKGSSTELTEWLPVSVLTPKAIQALQESVDPDISTTLDRIDARPGKGIVKYIFADHYWEVQLDAATGNVLHVGLRRSDFLERLHDGTLADNALRTSDGIIKLIYTTVMGLALITFSLTGFWLWYGPKVMRKLH